MPAGQLEGVMRHLRTVARQAGGAPVGDAELLERFIAHRDEEAFELLVRRHGPMVLGVCKRVLGNVADAEDAFQATFLVLVRKATSIVPRTQVGNWLHGVAHKTALKAKAMNSRRGVKEREGAARGRHAPDDTWQSLLEVLDAELGALPEKYRAPIILCDLEGLSYREAAARLHCPQGTLSGRLTRARALLARRVARRGRVVSAAALATLLARDALASVRPPLLASTVRAGAALAAGQALADGPVSCKVASLTEGVLKMLLLSRLKVVTGALLVLMAVVAAGWICAARVPARAAMPGDAAVPRAEDEPPAPARNARATDGPAESPEAEFIVRGADRDGKTVSLVVAGTSAPVLRLPVKEGVRILFRGRQVGLDGLRPGTRVVIRLDTTDRVIEDIRALAGPEKATILKGASDRADLEVPSEAEVVRALPRLPGNVPAFLEVYRDDIQVATERLVRQVDPPRFFPLVGEAELHHCHWKCTVYYRETVESSYPYRFRTKRPRVEVVYIDKDYLVPTR
jgi:RNA polymerase sigma factor (sigma-70 family)